MSYWKKIVTAKSSFFQKAPTKIKPDFQVLRPPKNLTSQQKVLFEKTGPQKSSFSTKSSFRKNGPPKI